MKLTLSLLPIILASFAIVVVAGKKSNRARYNMEFPSFLPPGLISCRREDADGNTIEESNCPKDYNCSVPDGGVQVQVGDVINKVFYCNNPATGDRCKVQLSNGEERIIKNCTDGKVCEGELFDAKNMFLLFGFKYYTCVKEPEPEEYVDALLDRLCCGGGSSFSFSANASSTTGSSTGGVIITSITGGRGSGGGGGRRRGRGKGGSRRRDGRSS